MGMKPVTDADYDRATSAGEHAIKSGDWEGYLQRLAERFCGAPLPETVCADLCATRQGPGRTGTNLLSVAEAKEVLRLVVFEPA